MTHRFVFVESNSTGTGRLMARAAARLGFRPVLLAADADRYPYAKEDGVEVRAIDTANEDAVVDTCRALHADGGVAGVTSSSEYFVGVAAAAAARIDRPAPPASAVRACADKSSQRRLLDSAGVSVPAFRVTASASEAVAAARAIGFPVVLKPVSGSGSIGVRLCEGAAEVAAHAASLVERRTNERGIAVPPLLLVEAFVDGPELSVEVFSSRVVGITQKHLGPPPSFVEVGHDFTADLPDRVRSGVEAAAIDAVRALGLDVGPAHVELRVGPRGATIIEVNPRLAGGFIPEIVRLAFGIDLLEANVRFASGTPLSLEPSWRRYASIRFFVPPADGALVDVRGLDAARATPLVVEAAAYRAPGDAIERRGDFRDRVGHVIACGDDRRAVIDAVEAARRLVSVRVAPNEALHAGGPA